MRNARSSGYGHGGGHGGGGGYGGGCCCCKESGGMDGLISPGLVAAAAAAFFVLLMAITGGRRKKRNAERTFEPLKSGFMEDLIMKGRNNNYIFLSFGFLKVFQKSKIQMSVQ